MLLTSRSNLAAVRSEYEPFRTRCSKSFTVHNTLGCFEAFRTSSASYLSSGHELGHKKHTFAILKQANVVDEVLVPASVLNPTKKLDRRTCCVSMGSAFDLQKL